jgi:hypothetical protein
MSSWSRRATLAALSTLTAIGLISACSAYANKGENGAGAGDGTATSGGGSGGNSGDGGAGGDGGFVSFGGSGGGNSTDFIGDPKTCEQAQSARTYLGCDFWPTVVANNVWSIFDYAVIVANAGDAVANVTIERNGQQVATGSVPPNGLQKFFLPWVAELKGPDANAMGSAAPLTASVRAPGGAYHLTASVPVTVYQFNALEYQPTGGPPGKDWSSCPGNGGVGCFSYSNDASLLLPSTAATGNYRITGVQSWASAGIGAYFAVTGLEDGTTVKVQVAGSGQIMAGNGVTATAGGGVTSFPISRGEVVEVLGNTTGDLSGSLVQADKPVQVITGIPCTQAPIGAQACDHVEESVFPAETLGTRYFVNAPTGPNGNIVGQLVRVYGNVSGTQLTYPAGQPAGAPTTINEGQVVQFGPIDQDFEIQGDHEFAVGLFMLGGSIVDPNAQIGNQKGDPAQSLAFAVEQYRTKYVFLAPDDYSVSYADIVMPIDASVTVDGNAVTPGTSALAADGYAVARVKLGAGAANGAHVLNSDKPVGLQVVGYGNYTSYQYPGGLNLKGIAPPPPPIQ